MSWIRVEDQLPARGSETVLVASPTMTEPSLAYFDHDTAEWYAAGSRRTIEDLYGVCDIDHWMPLPEMP